jgi:hypothetical protein
MNLSTTIVASLRARWPWPEQLAPTAHIAAGSPAGLFARAAGVAEAADAAHQRLAGDKDLSPAGRRKAGRKEALRLRGELAPLAGAIADYGAEVEARRAKLLAPPKPAPGVENMLLRQELRAHLRTLKADERAHLLLSNEAVQAAVAEALPALSGFDDGALAELLDRAARQRNATALAEIDRQAEAADAMRAAASVAWGGLARLAELSERETALFVADGSLPREAAA